MNVVAVIPARLGATRLPGKPLLKIGSKPMIQWVYENVSKAQGIDSVIVATDSPKICDTVSQFRGECRLTSAQCVSGTDRVAEVAKKEQGAIFINVQGDEPFLEPTVIEATLELVRSGRFEMASAMTALKDEQELADPSVVKALVDYQGKALYFSRMPIPFRSSGVQWKQTPVFRHIGLYVYTRETLLKLTSLAPSELEKSEKLEQLRALENGIPIGLAQVSSNSIGVDTQQDLDFANARHNEQIEGETLR